MNRIKDYGKLATDISNWIKQYADSNNIKSLVVGVSGGIDSAVVSTLCAMTGLPVYCAVIEIHSRPEEIAKAIGHCQWLQENNINCSWRHDNMNNTIETITVWGSELADKQTANSKSRLRMLQLYNYALAGEGIVVGTGNKVEDFGVGFYTKYGDGGVDISPIADLYKTEVRELGRYLGISEEILNAAPTDGLWADGRTDEQQIGATYKELEWAMEDYRFIDNKPLEDITPRQQAVIDIYRALNKKNRHKMQPIPIYKLPL